MLILLRIGLLLISQNSPDEPRLFVEYLAERSLQVEVRVLVVWVNLVCCSTKGRLRVLADVGRGLAAVDWRNLHRLVLLAASKGSEDCCLPGV